MFCTHVSPFNTCIRGQILLWKIRTSAIAAAWQQWYCLKKCFSFLFILFLCFEPHTGMLRAYSWPCSQGMILAVPGGLEIFLLNDVIQDAYLLTPRSILCLHWCFPLFLRVYVFHIIFYFNSDTHLCAQLFCMYVYVCNVAECHGLWILFSSCLITKKCVIRWRWLILKI